MAGKGQLGKERERERERERQTRGREGAFRFISARRMPRRVSINSRRGANSCRWNARVLRPRREVVRLCVPFGRATGFPIGDSSLIRRWRVSNRTRTNGHLRVCYTVTVSRRAYLGVVPIFLADKRHLPPAGREKFLWPFFGRKSPLREDSNACATL